MSLQWDPVCGPHSLYEAVLTAVMTTLVTKGNLIDQHLVSYALAQLIHDGNM